MKTKMELAHDFAMTCKRPDLTLEGVVFLSWQYADAMQAESDKREKEKQSEHVFEAIDDWQPDWSQAPEWAKWWVATADREGKISGGWFYENEPELGAGKGPSVYYSPSRSSILTDSFGYTGDWRNSLRKRPQ